MDHLSNLYAIAYSNLSDPIKMLLIIREEVKTQGQLTIKDHSFWTKRINEIIEEADASVIHP